MPYRSSSSKLLLVPIVLFIGAGGFFIVRGSSGPDDPLSTVGDVTSASGYEVELVTAQSDQVTALTLPAPATDLPEAPPETLPAETSDMTSPTPPPNDDDHDHKHDRHYDRAADLADPTDTHGYDVHTFTDHVTAVLGAHMLAPGQQPAAGYTWVDDNTVVAHAPITGLRPVVEQAITDIREKHPEASGDRLESKIAKRLTELNDWDNLTRETRWKMMILSQVDIADMDHDDREDYINHILHSPLTFGTIEEVLTPDVTVDMGYTHTLDKDWTQVADLGNGVFQIWMVSNNNNGSHTGHVLGSFKVQLAPGTSLEDARHVGNDMVRNENNNDRLYLDEAARAVLYGQTPWLDYSNLSEADARALFEGKGLPQNPAGMTHDHGEGTMPPAETTTTTAAPTGGESTTTTAPSGGQSTSTTAPTGGQSTTTTAPAGGQSTTTTAHAHG